MLNEGVAFLYGNARPQVSNQTQHLTKSFGWKQLDHPPYSPDLALSDYHVFLHLERHLGCQFHNNNEDVKTTVFSYDVVDFYKDCIQKLVARYNATILVGIMQKSSLKYRLSCKNTIMKKSLQVFFQNGINFKNTPRITK